LSWWWSGACRLTRPERRPAPQIADPLLQWASGLPTADRRLYAGWLVEAGKDEALDGAMERAGFSRITIKHGSGNLVDSALAWSTTESVAIAESADERPPWDGARYDRREDLL
jgi:hypothetical protein